MSVQEAPAPTAPPMYPEVEKAPWATSSTAGTASSTASSGDVENQLLLSESDRITPIYVINDWQGHEHVRNSSRVCSALVIGILGLLFFWPLCFIGLYLVYGIRKRILENSYMHHRHWCKVTTTYWINVIGIVLGILETIALIVLATRGDLNTFFANINS